MVRQRAMDLLLQLPQELLVGVGTSPSEWAALLEQALHAAAQENVRVWDAHWGLGAGL